MLNFFFNFKCLAYWDQAGFSYLFLHSICCDMLFWLKYMKKTQHHTDMWLEKGRRIFLKFSLFTNILLYIAFPVY